MINIKNREDCFLHPRMYSMQICLITLMRLGLRQIEAPDGLLGTWQVIQLWI